METVSGIDVSHWSGRIDWSRVRATGQRFAFVKATESETYVDPTFDDNWLGAKSAGLLRGAYHFFRVNADPGRQANLFINTIRSMPDMGELPPVLDLETNDGQTNARVIARAKLWLDAVETAFRKRPIIYSGYYFLRDHFSETGGGPPAWTKDYPLWLAQYPYQYTLGSQPALPRGWFTWSFWQYNDKGQVNGVPERVDMDVFNGTLDALYQFAGATPPETRPRIHVVTQGDTLESVASGYGITLSDLVAANPTLLKIGDTLTIPGQAGTGGGSSTPPTSQKTYTVVAGDTLTAIAARFHTTVAEIARLNNIQDINSISVGQVLKIA